MALHTCQKYRMFKMDYSSNHYNQLHLDRRVPVWPNNLPMINPLLHSKNVFNPIGIGSICQQNSDGTLDVFVKVIGFPTPKGSQYASESMYVFYDNKSLGYPKKKASKKELRKWLEIILFKGEGQLVNFPNECNVVKYGDRVIYGEGGEGIKAKFICKANNVK